MTDPRRLGRILRAETATSVAINALVPTAIIWLAGVPAPVRFGGSDGLVQAMLKASGLATLAMTLILTAIIRARVRGGGLPALAPARLAGPARLLPRPLVPRALVMAFAAMVLLVPVGAAVAAVLRILPLDRPGAVLFDILFGALVGLTMTATVVRRALADPVARTIAAAGDRA